MKALPKVPLTWNWSGVKTDANDRSLQPGEVTSLINWRRTVEGRLQKRLGNDKTTVSTFTGATYAGPCTEMIPHDSILFRDTSNQLWAKNATDGAAYYRGTVPRAHATWRALQNRAAGGVCKPLAVLRSTDLWLFSIDATQGYQVQLIDLATGTIKGNASVVTSVVTGVSSNIRSWSACLDSNNLVNLFFVTDAAPTVIQVNRFSASGASVDANTYTTEAALNFSSIFAHKLASGAVIVGATSLTTGGGSHTFGTWVSQLDTATLTPSAEVTTTATALQAEIPCCSGISIYGTGSNGSFYVAFWRTSASVTDQAQLIQQVHATSNLAVSATNVLSTVDSDDHLNGNQQIGVTGGYVDGSNQVVLASLTAMGTLGPSAPAKTKVIKVVWSGSATETTVAKSAYLASIPFQIGSSWYFLTGFDHVSSTFAYRLLGAQRGYFVRNSDGVIMSTILDGLGAEIWHAGGMKSTGSHETGEHWYGHVVVPQVSGTDAYVGLLRAGDMINHCKPTLVTVDFAPTCHSTANGIVPGGMPVTVSKDDTATELAPIHYPYEEIELVNNGDNAAHSTNFAAIRYVTINAAGEITPSSPSPTQTLPFLIYDTPSDDYTVRVPNLRHTIGKTWIELYFSENQLVGGADTSLYLYKRVINDPTVDYTDIAVNPDGFGGGQGALFETTNLETRLEQASLPPARLATRWRDRMWLAGTPEDDVWYSQEKRAGHGYEFNEALSVVWQDGAGPITAICPLSFDALAVFRQGAIGLITGPGPDPAGPNNYVVQTISYQEGVSNPAGVVAGPAGVYFINAADGRPHVITTGGVVTKIAQGYEAYTAQVPTASVHDVAQRVVRWYMSSGKQIKLDYSKPLPGQPAGEWSEDNNSNLPAAVGACVISGAAVMLEAGTASVARTWQAGTGFTDDGTAVLRDLVAGRLAPVGLLGEFDLDEFQLSKTHQGGDSAYTYTLTPDTGSAETHADSASSTADVWFRSALSRLREFRMRIQETSATGEGHSFDGVATIIRPRGTFQNPYRRIA